VAFSVFVEIAVLVFLLFGVGTAYGPWWSIAGTLLLAELIGWTIRHRSIVPAIDSLTHSVTVLGRAGQRSTAALGQLKDVRERVMESRADQATGVPPGTEPTADSTVDRRRRFDAGDQAASQAVHDLQEALDGAHAEHRPAEQTRPPGPEDSPEQDRADATSRLLRAKRRARRKMDKEEE
jgi:hypothetical protein